MIVASGWREELLQDGGSSYTTIPANQLSFITAIYAAGRTAATNGLQK